MAANLGPKIIRSGLVLVLDAIDKNSYTGSGTSWRDMSGSNCLGTLTNGPVYYNNTTASSIGFGGGTDYVDIANTSANYDFANTTFTISIWVRFFGSQTKAVVGKGLSTGGWAIYTNTNGTMYFIAKNSSGLDAFFRYTSSTLNDNRWHNFVAVVTTNTTTVSSNDIQLYVDGVLNNGAITKSNVYSTQSAQPINIGRRSLTGSGSDYFNGLVSNVAIYNRGLSSIEIIQNYNEIRKRYEYSDVTIASTPSLYLDASNASSYPGSGTVWTDLSGNSRTGTLTNGPTYNSENGGSIVFDGTNDYVDVTNTVSALAYANTSFTVSIWFKQSTLSNGALISKGGASAGWSIWAVSDGTINSYMKNGSGVDNYDRFTSAVITANTWINITAIFTTNTTVAANNSVIHYVNGIINTGSIIATGNTYGSDTTTNLNLGRRTTSPFLNGNIGTVQIFSRALTAVEVLQNFDATRTRFGI